VRSKAGLLNLACHGSQTADKQAEAGEDASIAKRTGSASQLEFKWLRRYVTTYNDSKLFYSDDDEDGGADDDDDDDE